MYFYSITAKVPKIGEFKFNVHQKADQYISKELIRDQIWEPFETEVFRRLCQQGDCILDIGANIGWYSIIASKLIGQNGAVIAYEPDPLNYKLLKKNTSLSKASNIRVKNIAIGDDVKTTKLFLSDTNLGDHRLFDADKERDSIDVSVLTLDSLFKESRRLPDIVKSDTQGSEGLIFKGANYLLTNGWRPIWLIEFWPFGLVNSDQDPMGLWETLSGLGYIMYEVSEANPKLVHLDKSRVTKRLNTDISAESTGFINILALPIDSNRFTFLTGLIS